MSKFDGPHFEVEHEDVVSVWLASPTLEPIPDEYFEEGHGEDDEAAFNKFSSDFCFGFYDQDFTELVEADHMASMPVEELLSGCSYSASFVPQAAQRAGALGIMKCHCAFLMYNFKYDPNITGINESKFLRFVGVFPFSRNAT